MVRGIPKEQTHEWLLKKHYAHRIPSISYAFGLYQDEQLVGVCTFGKPANNFLCEGICGSDYKSLVLELNRLCLNDDVPKNSESYFVSRCLNLLPTPAIIVSYADDGQGHKGYIYQACNFIYTGATKERTDIFTGDGKHSRHYDKHTVDYSKRIKRTSKHRYICFCGTKKEKKHFLALLQYPIEPYPKGDNANYDASYQPKIQGVLNI